MAKEPMKDVVVLLPGILGSVLARDGKDVWAPSPGAIGRALWSLGRNVRDLALTDDPWEQDDLGDGVTAPRLMPDIHLVPGLWSIDGYTGIRKMIGEQFDVVAGENYVEMPYDWRRDNRVAARTLRRLADEKLHAARQRHADAKLVLIGHSMGGLVARYFLEYRRQAGGWVAPHVQLEVRNTTDDDLYVAVLDLTDRFRCQTVLPTARLADNARMWLEEFRCDGLRWDATAYIRNVYGNDNDPAHDVPDGWRLCQRITGETERRQPWKLHIAEDLRDNPGLTAPVEAGGAGFSTQWDGGFVHPVRQAMTAASDGGRNMEALRDAIVRRDHGDAFRRVIYTESHDEVANGKQRLPEEIAPGDAGSVWAQKRSTLAAALALTTPGIPMLFQGQEILEDAWFHDQDPIDWSKEHTHGGILNLYRDLIRLRRDRDGTTRGLRGHHVNAHHVNDEDNVIAFHRWHHGGPGDDVIVVANVGNRRYDSYRIGLPRSGQWRLRFNSDWAGYSALFDDHPSLGTDADEERRDGMACSGNVGIGRYTAIVLSQDPI